MSKSESDPTFGLGAVNICNGGTQIINVYGVGGRGGTGLWPPFPFPFKFLFDDHAAATTNGDPHGDHWCIAETSSGIGTIVRFSVFFQNLNPGTTIYARVYDGLNGSVDEEYIPSDSRYVPADPDSSDPRWWVWDRKLTGVTFSTAGVPHHVRVFKVHNNQGERDDSKGFLAVPCSGSGSYAAPPQQVSLAHAPALGVDVLDGAHAGLHIAERIGRALWKIAAGPLKGLIEFTTHGGALSVRTPNGLWTFPVSGERPFSLVLPGELFGSSRDVVVTAP